MKVDDTTPLPALGPFTDGPDRAANLMRALGFDVIAELVASAEVGSRARAQVNQAVVRAELNALLRQGARRDG